MSDSIIQINNMNKWFGDFQVLKKINLEVKPKEKIVVCGPSGSGKSTLIRCINRLEEHQEGNIIVDGTELTEDTKNIEQIRAEVGMVFQQFNLFPHLSILDNCTLAPIWVKKMPKKEAEELALKLVIPGIANTFLALVKDTPLIFVVGLLEIVGMLNLAKTNPKWLGFAMEGYVFAAIIFWIICYAMSKYSYNLEQKYKTDR